MNKGTPKTLEEAIRNGLIHWHPLAFENSENRTAENIILSHIVDFIAQKFTPYIYRQNNDEFVKLFEQITGRKVGK